MPNFPESELVKSAFFRIRDHRGTFVCVDVPLLGRCVDLVYLQNDLVITVEFKLRDWRRAITQARDHLLAADYAYICMPNRPISKLLRQALDRNGIGLVFFAEQGAWPFSIAVQAKRSLDTWRHARDTVLAYMRQAHLGNDKTAIA